jgi:hypothetical protein
MNVDSRRQCANTRAKLRELEQLYEEKRAAPADACIRELTLRSINKRINQFREETARFEARARSVSP